MIAFYAIFLPWWENKAANWFYVKLSDGKTDLTNFYESRIYFFFEDLAFSHNSMIEKHRFKMILVKWKKIIANLYILQGKFKTWRFRIPIFFTFNYQRIFLKTRSNRNSFKKSYRTLTFSKRISVMRMGLLLMLGLTLWRQVILWCSGLARTLHSKYTSSPSFMFSAFKVLPRCSCTLGGTEKNY